MNRSFLRKAALCASMFVFSHTTPAADLMLSGGPWLTTVNRMDLQHGAGSDFSSPVATDVLIATLSVSATGGGNWSLLVARETNEGEWPPGLTIAVKRSGAWDESGLSDGISYRALTADLQTLCSGTGDYASIQILLRVDGLSVTTQPGSYALGIRYVVQIGGP